MPPKATPWFKTLLSFTIKASFRNCPVGVLLFWSFRACISCLACKAVSGWSHGAALSLAHFLQTALVVGQILFVWTGAEVLGLGDGFKLYLVQFFVSPTWTGTGNPAGITGNSNHLMWSGGTGYETSLVASCLTVLILNGTISEIKRLIFGSVYVDILTVSASSEWWLF